MFHTTCALWLPGLRLDILNCIHYISSHSLRRWGDWLTVGAQLWVYFWFCIKMDFSVCKGLLSCSLRSLLSSGSRASNRCEVQFKNKLQPTSPVLSIYSSKLFPLTLCLVLSAVISQLFLDLVIQFGTGSMTYSY